MAFLGRIFLAVAVISAFAFPARAGLIEQVGCVYDAIPKETRQELAAAYLRREAPEPGDRLVKAKAKDAAADAQRTCTKQYDWTGDDSENATRYMLFHTLADDMAAKLSPETRQIADAYFNQNVGTLINQDDFMTSDVWPIRVDFQAKGLKGEDVENAIVYLAWTVITQQLRGDFATGKLRG